MAAYSAQVNLEDPSATRIKSGFLARKHLYERTDKKANNRSWRECLVVVERGEMKMFKKEKDAINGDGSELTNVQLQLGQLTLRHSLTVQLPPPGYSKRRAHVFAVQLPNGGVYLFQAASTDLVCEWVAVCNYWVARESKEPLGGGVGNVDYGW
ncbi:Pleckstrin homology domain-containing protein, partial [Syncephalis pseudoplumigaleata]